MDSVCRFHDCIIHEYRIYETPDNYYIEQQRRHTEPYSLVEAAPMVASLEAGMAINNNKGKRSDTSVLRSVRGSSSPFGTPFDKSGSRSPFDTPKSRMQSTMFSEFPVQHGMYLSEQSLWYRDGLDYSTTSPDIFNRPATAMFPVTGSDNPSHSSGWASHLLPSRHGDLAASLLTAACKKTAIGPMPPNQMTRPGRFTYTDSRSIDATKAYWEERGKLRPGTMLPLSNSLESLATNGAEGKLTPRTHHMLRRR